MSKTWRLNHNHVSSGTTTAITLARDLIGSGSQRQWLWDKGRDKEGEEDWQ